MRVTSVPAQVTTVEDRIVGSLNFKQLLLLSVPVFTGGLVYVLLPPMMSSTMYKLIFLVALVFICSLLAISFKGTLVLYWVSNLCRYWLRPHYYLFNKHSLVGRELGRALPEATVIKSDKAFRHAEKDLPLSLEDVVRVQEVIENSANQVVYEIRKGGLYVRITEST